MPKIKLRLCLIALAIFPIAATQAQETLDKGIYAVARAGAELNPDLKFDLDALDVSSSIDDKVKYKVAPFGEIGGGYSFGTFRAEETLGYSSSNAKSADVQGRARFYFLTISGFADIPVTDLIVPYIGGGMGAVRVDTDLSFASAITDTQVSLQGKSWGPFWHLDTGVGFRITPKVTADVGVRYEKTFGTMKGIGHSDDYGLASLAQFDAAAGMVGVRYRF